MSDIDASRHRAEMSTRYQYRPLNPKKREIRVLSIDVNNPTAPAEPTPLECTVERISLTAWIRPSYYAVSYVWGDASRLATIKLDGQLVQIPYNSEQALRCLYRRTKDEVGRIGYRERNSNKQKQFRFSPGYAYQKPVYSPSSDDGRVRIWLDAICIDQHNVAERNSQVAMMGLIYRAAVRTLIWLGEPDQSTHASVESVRLIVQQCKDSTKGLSDLYRLTRGSHYRRGSPRVSVDLLPARCDWSAIEALYGRAWFTRLWVVQEALLAETAVAYVGQHRFRFFDLALAARWMTHRRPDLVNHIGYEPRGIANAATMFDCMANVVVYKLEPLLLMGLHFDSTDPRDKIYGMLGLKLHRMSGSLTVLPFVPDYTRSIAEIYRDAARIALYESGTLSLLRECQFGPEQDPALARSRQPSWVPRFDQSTSSAIDDRTKLFTPDKRQHEHFAIRYSIRESARMLSPVRFNLDRLDAPELLRVPGQVVGRVFRLGPRLTKALLQDRQQLREHLAVMRGWAADADRVYEMENPTGHRSADTAAWDVRFALTLTCGVDEHNEPISPDDHHRVLEDFRAFCRPSGGTAGADDMDATDDGFLKRMAFAGLNRRFGTTANGFYGMFPTHVREGDSVVLLSAAPVPFVLRQCGDRRWLLIGDAFLNRVVETWIIKDILLGRHRRARVMFDIK